MIGVGVSLVDPLDCVLFVFDMSDDHVGRREAGPASRVVEIHFFYPDDRLTIPGSSYDLQPL